MTGGSCSSGLVSRASTLNVQSWDPNQGCPPGVVSLQYTYNSSTGAGQVTVGGSCRIDYVAAKGSTNCQELLGGSFTMPQLSHISIIVCCAS